MTVEYENASGIAIISLNRPERLNAVTPDLVSGLSLALDRASSDEAKVVVLRGNGRAFCAGHDLKEEPLNDPERVRADAEGIQDVTRRIRQGAFVVLASVHGYALGAGCEFALCSDLVIAADDAQFGFPEVGVGLSVTGGISHVLPLAVGLARAKELVLLGNRFDSGIAREWGLINWVVPSGELGTRTQEVARQLTSRPTESLLRAKRVLDAGPEGALEAALGREVVDAVATATSEDAVRASVDFRSRERR